MARNPLAVAGTTSATVQEWTRAKDQDVGFRTQHRESCTTSKTFHLSSRAQEGLAKTLRCFRPESGIEEHVIYTMHQRTL